MESRRKEGSQGPSAVSVSQSRRVPPNQAFAADAVLDRGAHCVCEGLTRRAADMQDRQAAPIGVADLDRQEDPVATRYHRGRSDRGLDPTGVRHRRVVGRAAT